MLNSPWSILMYELWTQKHDSKLLKGSFRFLYKAGHWQMFVKLLNEVPYLMRKWALLNWSIGIYFEIQGAKESRRIVLSLRRF